MTNGGQRVKCGTAADMPRAWKGRAVTLVLQTIRHETVAIATGPPSRGRMLSRHRPNASAGARPVDRTPPDVNTDLSVAVAIDATAREWEASPSSTVWRKSFYRKGGEKGPVTSMVRYDAHSSFARHEHPEGEEILVLDGVFSDEYGAYPAGSFLLNPPGFAHSPRSEPGCTLFVHLRQYGGPGRPHIALDTGSIPWRPTQRTGIARRDLYGERAFAESIRLEQWAPGTAAIIDAAAVIV